MLKEVLQNVTSLYTWDCSLVFPDKRYPDGVIDLCAYLKKPTNILRAQISMPTNFFYCFDDSLYDNEIDSEQKLVKDLINAARNSGFSLTVRSSTAEHVGALWAKKILLGCKKGRIYNGKKVQELENNFKSNGNMMAPLRDVSNSDTCNKKRRKTSTGRATCSDNTCPFTFSIFLHASEKRWYLKASTRSSPEIHLNHRKLHIEELPTSTKLLTAGDIEKLNIYSTVHLTSTQSAALLNKIEENCNVLPSQVQYITRREALLASNLTEVTSSADALLRCLQERPEVTYMTLTDDAGEASGLLVTTNKGRPSKICTELANQFSAQAIHKQLTLHDDQSLLLAVCWITNEERRLTEMFPEVLYMDVTSQTNNEKRPLFLVAGKDNYGRSFTAARIFLPSEQSWVFRWIFQNCLPELFGDRVTKRNKLVITDGDSHCYDAFKEAALQCGPWEGSSHLLCQWHLLSYSWKREVSSHAPAAKPHLNNIASLSYRWIQTWF